jgi:tRNA(Ile)-lysidine synthase
MTAHHADDIAETVMMHLARGCGINGLCGVRERNSSFGHVDVVRPLLKVRKKKLEELCNKANVPYCIDKSNFNTEKSRAYVRHSVIPVLEKLNPAFVEHVVKTAMFMQDIVEKESYGKNNRTKKHTSSIDG